MIRKLFKKLSKSARESEPCGSFSVIRMSWRSNRA